MRRCLALLLSVTLAAPGWASERVAEGDAPTSPEDPAPPADPSTDDAAPAAPLPDFGRDALGRVFPDPDVLRRTRGWWGGGVAMTVAGGGLALGGLALGSAVLRNEIDFEDDTPLLDRGPRPSLVMTGVMIGSGAALVLVGVPLWSAGEFSSRQLNRTIRGAEKVPRTVANELTYWQAYRDFQYGQGTSIAGGAGIAFGVLGFVAVGATVGTDRYDPRFWAVAAAPLGVGVGALAGGMALQRSSRARMEAIRDERDPARQISLRVSPPLPLPGPRGFTLAWSGSF